MTDACLHGVAWNTPLGWIIARATNDELLGLSFGFRSRSAAVASLPKASNASIHVPADGPDWLRRLASRLTAFTDGRPDDFRDAPLSLNHLGAFQRKVVACCRQIPFGAVVTYGQLAAQAGSPRAARAVGTTMSGNRFPLIVPCHRVVGAHGLGGYSAVDGLSTKRRLLELEGAWSALQARGLRRNKQEAVASCIDAANLRFGLDQQPRVKDGRGPQGLERAPPETSLPSTSTRTSPRPIHPLQTILTTD